MARPQRSLKVRELRTQFEGFIAGSAFEGNRYLTTMRLAGKNPLRKDFFDALERAESGLKKEFADRRNSDDFMVSYVMNLKSVITGRLSMLGEMADAFEDGTLRIFATGR